jgi:hypothetical protein
MPSESSEFVFQRGFYLVELTGKKAENLKEFLKCIQTVDDESIFYHVYHTLRQHHFVIPDYSNDFAHWFRKDLHEDVLAERFTYVRISEYGDIKAVKERFIEILRNRLEDRANDSPNVPEERAFHFVRARAIALPTKYRAKNIEEFVECLEKIDRETLFYHFFSARLKFSKSREKHVDDFSRWINEIGHPEIADRITALNPYGYTLEGTRKEIAEIIRGAK